MKALRITITVDTNRTIEREYVLETSTLYRSVNGAEVQLPASGTHFADIGELLKHMYFDFIEGEDCE